MSKPAKQARMMGQYQVTRTESVGLLPLSNTTVVNDPHTSSHPLAQGETVKDQTPRHPKGHKTAELASVWATMDKQEYLRVTDTLALSDVWSQPKSIVAGVSSNVVSVEMVQIVDAPHIKSRTCTTKMAVDDLLRIMYLNESVQWTIQGPARYSYDEWLADKTAAFIKAHGVDKTSDRAGLCSFILNEDREFSFYPQSLKNVGIFVRKICYHSYKDSGKDKIANPSMMKCISARGTFDYLFEARLFPLPSEWWSGATVEEEVPESQAM